MLEHEFDLPLQHHQYNSNLEVKVCYYVCFQIVVLVSGSPRGMVDHVFSGVHAVIPTVVCELGEIK